MTLGGRLGEEILLKIGRLTWQNSRERFFYRIVNQRLSDSGRSSRLVMQFHSRELLARNSVVIWLVQLLPEEDALCCSISASSIADWGTVME